MKPLPVAIAVAVLLALLWWFWPRDKAPPPPVADASKAPVASTAPAAPPASAEAPPPAPAPAPVVEPPPRATVYFAFDRSALRPDDAAALDAFVAKLQARDYTSVVVKGYADRIGEAPHNDALSKKRAEAAVAYLTSKGVDAKRSRVEAKGESEPVTGDTCKDLGAEDAKNAKLVDCLEKDRRAVIEVAL
ncbi:MAG: OmpA family protein [Burkholderiales bacterium]|nr:OmpA family protein [Burkholderiales bacterium]